LATEQKSPERVRFADFEFDCHSGDLRRDGTSLKLQPQPAKVLAVLVRRAGQVITRQELAEQVWGSETFVDFEQGLNYAIRQIRSALEDDADQPRFLETLPKRGYRFIAQVDDHAAVVGMTTEPVNAAPASTPRLRKNTLRLGLAFLAAALIAVALVSGLLWNSLRQRWFGPAGTHRIESLAVLPLHNLSRDPEQEYFSDGMTDELITDLAKYGGLRVISHTSVERYKETKRPLPEIAKELGVDAVVEGTVMRAGDRVRITVQLIDARSDRHLWAESYERDFRDILALQDEVAERITGEVGTNLTRGKQPHLASKQTSDPAAHEAYLKGNFYWNRLTCDGFKKGLENFQQAVAKDPNFALAYVGLAEAYFTLGDWGCRPQDETIPKSKAAALKALELDNNLGPAHAWLGKIAFFYEWDWPKAKKELQQALELDPNYVPAHLIYAVFLVSMGEREQGLAEMNRARELDPTSELTNVIGTYVFYLTHQFDQAIEEGERTVEFYPGSTSPYIWLAASYEMKGMQKQAIAAYLDSWGLAPDRLTSIRSVYEKAGPREYWRHELAKSNQAGNPCWMATIYMHLGDKERALAYLNRGFQQPCSGLHVLKVDPLYDSLRDDPRFKDLMARLRL
jgi:TolB-like protein/DNA-binding winged helix-turn-helix (wHTH) protein/Tfp pilus assembly protein PilF